MIDDDLTRVLGTRAGRAPRPPEDLARKVEVAYRRRQRRRSVAVAGGVVVVTAGTVAAVAAVVPDAGYPVARGTPSPGPTATASSGPVGPTGPNALPVFQVKRTGPMEELWPDAVRRVPARLPDGRAYSHVAAILDDRRVLVVVQVAFEQAGELLAWDTTSGAATTLARLDTSGGRFMQRLVVGERYVAWTASTGLPRGTDVREEVWAVPRTGGTPRRLSEGRAMVTGIAAPGDRVAWSREGAGVFVAPGSGGPVTLLPGTAGHHLLRWPWTFRKPLQMSSPEPFRYTDQLNVETGARRTVPRPPGTKSMYCGIAWCTGVISGKSEQHFVQRVDGTGAADLSSLGRPFRYPLGRFLEVHRPPGRPITLLDLDAGVLAVMPDGWVSDHLGDPRIGVWRNADGSFGVLDLSQVR